MLETLWMIRVFWKGKQMAVWFTLSELAKAKAPRAPDGKLLATKEYRQDLRGFGNPDASEPLILKEAWIHSPGRLTCDTVQRHVAAAPDSGD